MVNYQLCYTEQAKKDLKKVASSCLRKQIKKILALLSSEPYKNLPRFEKLVGDLDGASHAALTFNTELYMKL